MRLHLIAATLAALGLVAAAPVEANADAFNGRIGFTSFRVDHDPGPGTLHNGDIFSITPAGADVRQLTSDPEYDAQMDWSPDGTAIAYRIRKPGFATNFEVARMTAGGDGHRRITFTEADSASSQPSWFPDMSGILFRRSGGGAPSETWRMGPSGDDPLPKQLFYVAIPGSQWYPSYAPDMARVLFATTMSPMGDTDRGIFTVAADGSGLTTVLDRPATFESAPAWSRDGRWIAFESNGDLTGGNREGDMEIFVMDGDGGAIRQLTSNSAHDEGPAWSPDGTMLAYTSGPDNVHGDIHVMTAGGVQLAQLTDDEGRGDAPDALRDESPDWQAIPAPDTQRRCGDGAAGVRDVRATRVTCRRARALAARWARDAGPRADGRFAAQVTDFGGTLRVVLTCRAARSDDARRGRRLVAFLYEPA